MNDTRQSSRTLKQNMPPPNPLKPSVKDKFGVSVTAQQLHILHRQNKQLRQQLDKQTQILSNCNLYSDSFDDDIDRISTSDRLADAQRTIRDLMQQQKELRQKHRKQEQVWLEELQDKEMLIEELNSYTETLKEQNNNLKEEIAIMEKQMMQEQLRNAQAQKQIKRLLIEIGDQSSPSSLYEMQQIQTEPLCEDFDQSQKSCNSVEGQPAQGVHKIQHDQQIQELIDFYQKQINIVKQVYDREILNDNPSWSNLSNNNEPQCRKQTSQKALGSTNGSYCLKRSSNLKAQLINNLSIPQQYDAQSQFTSKYFSYQGTKIVISTGHTESVEEETPQHGKSWRFAWSRLGSALGGAFVGSIATFLLLTKNTRG